MPELLLCSQSFEADYLQTHHEVSADNIFGLAGSKLSRINAYTPYILGNNLSNIDKGVINQLSALPHAKTRELTNLSLSFGEENAIGIADVTAKLHEYNIGLVGASTSVYANRIGGFAGSVKNYQAALMEYRKVIKAEPAAKLLAKERAWLAFQQMQRNFRNELNIVTARSRTLARRGTPLTSATRGTNIARSSRNAVKLNITSQVQASRLMKFSQHAKFLGNGLAVIDFGSRIGNIHNSYKAGGNWERDLFIESSSFAASAGAGILAVNAGTAALGLLMVATPVGWLGLIVGGIAVAGVATAASMGMNNVVKENSGGLYDDIIKWVSRQ